MPSARCSTAATRRSRATCSTRRSRARRLRDRRVDVARDRAELACVAVRQLASLPDSAHTLEGQAIRALAIELAAFDARRLDIELASWIAAMDALAAAPNAAAWTAARAKADILVDALSDAATRTQARGQLAAQLLGRAP